MWELLAIGGAIFESAAMITEKKGLSREHAMEFCAAMSLFAMLFTTPLWMFTNPKAMPLEAVIWIFLASITTAFSIYFLAKSLRHMAISYTAPFLSFGPLITAILALTILGEKISGIQWAGVLCMNIGIYVLYANAHKHPLEPFKHIFNIPQMKYIFLGIIFYALTGVLDKKIVGETELNVPVIAYLTLLFFFMAVIFIIMMLIFHNGFEGIGNGMRRNTKWLSLVALFTITFKFLVMYAIALPGALLSLIIPIKKLSSLFATVVGGELFHEEHIFRKAIACLIMIVGAILLML